MDALEYELLQEKAWNLMRLGNRLRQALDALQAFDAERAGGAALPEKDAERREELLAEAGEALWYYVIQREVSGMRDNAAVMREMGVPREVQLRMGLASTRRKTGSG
jgi:hypothetical protein